MALVTPEMASQLEATVRVLVERCDHPAYNGAPLSSPGTFERVGDLLSLLFARDLMEDYRAAKRLTVHSCMGFDRHDAEAVCNAVERAIGQKLDCAQPLGPDTLVCKWV